MVEISLIPYELDFKFEAGTSRGVLKQKKTWFVSIEKNGVRGVGEAGPLPKLSIDDFEVSTTVEFQALINSVKKVGPPNNVSDVYFWVKDNIPENYPAMRFAFETAWLDFLNGGKQIIINSGFISENKPIIINGLVWMGNEAFMLNQIKTKLSQGFRCLKMKIGAIDFKTEYKLLKSIREHFSKDQLVLRVDANGAFDKTNVFEVLEKLAKLDIHSIEQPIKAGQIAFMNEVCQKSPIPIALDEELIGVFGSDKKRLLESINPQYVIFKPTLLGGFAETLEWIDLCSDLNIDWWITSALESNVGLNAIAQFTAKYANENPQGLGTGQLYHNNIESPLDLKGDLLYYNTDLEWGLSEVLDKC